MRVARLTSSAVSVLLALGALGCSEAVRPAPSATTTVPSPAPARLTVTPGSVDLGVVGFGEPAVAEFVVRNDGGAPLTLATTRLSRASRVDGLVPALAPGESVRLRFSIDTFEGDGNRVQSFTLVTNDPENPRVVLDTRLDVRPFLVVRPGYARYIVVQHAREGTIAQTIASTDGITFKVLRVESPSPTLRLSFREARPDERLPSMAGSQWRVLSTLASDSPVGALTGHIVAHTDHPRQKRAFIPLSGFVRPIFAVTPPEARLGELLRSRPNPIHLNVKNFAEEEIEVTGVSTDVAAVKVDVQSIERGRSWRVRLFPSPEAPAGPFEGKILVDTANPRVPRIEIPLTGRLVDAVAPGR